MYKSVKVSFPCCEVEDAQIKQTHEERLRCVNDVKWYKNADSITPFVSTFVDSKHFSLPRRYVLFISGERNTITTVTKVAF